MHLPQASKTEKIGKLTLSLYKDETHDKKQSKANKTKDLFHNVLTCISNMPTMNALPWQYPTSLSQTEYA